MADRGAATLPTADILGPDAVYNGASATAVAHYTEADLPDDSSVVEIPAVSVGQLYPK